MMYSNKLAIAVKSNGKVLREFDKDKVYVPFGTEYTLLIKNLNTVRVQVRVTIDGTDATDGTWLIVGAGQEMELTRFIKNGNLNQGNRFKFIERTAAIENGPRGVGIEDGLIQVEYQFERVYEYKPEIKHFWSPPPPLWPVKRERWVKEEYYDWYSVPMYGSVEKSVSTGSPLRSMASRGTSASLASSNVSAQNVFLSQASDTLASYSANAAQASASVTASVPVNEAGITVPGSISDQKFTTVASFDVEPTVHTMVIKLLGTTEGGAVVTQPVTVKAKPKCTTCGRVNKANAKFCTECGTSLEIV